MTEDGRDRVEKLRDAVNSDTGDLREESRRLTGKSGSAPISNDEAGVRLSYEALDNALTEARRDGGTPEAIEKAARYLEAESGGQFDAQSLARRANRTKAEEDELREAFFRRLHGERD